MPRFEKYQSKTDGKWCVVTVPDNWPPDTLDYTDLLPPPSQTDKWVDSEPEADAEIARRAATPR